MVEEIKPDKVYTTEEVRSFLKISESTMKRMLKNGIIKTYKIGNLHRIWGREILKMLSPEDGYKVYKAYKNFRAKTKNVIEKW